MQITARPHVPTPAALAQAPTASTTADRPDRPGGSDTPFTHALERGNGRKLGIHRRLPTTEDVAAEQQAAGLSSEVPTTEAPTGEAPVVAAPVVDGSATDVVAPDVPASDATPPVDAPVLDAPVLDVPTLDLQAPEESVLDALLDAADPVEGADGGAAQDEPLLS